MKFNYTIKRNEKCRVCKAGQIEKVLDFGPTPLANAFLSKEEVNKEEYFYPLQVFFCKKCTMLQLGHAVSSKLLFDDYVYVSSTSPVFIQHFVDFALQVATQFNVKKNSLVIDLGSNDGILLHPFKKIGYRVLGIEPASNIAKIARKKGVDTVDEFFNIPLAKKLKRKKGKAEIITATNVFAHIDDLDEVIRGVKILLDRNGAFIIEAPYLIDFIEKRYFDLVYHEHMSYWSIRSLQTLFKRFGMTIFDVQKVPVHGGSVRVFVKHKSGKQKVQKSVLQFLKQEKKIRLHKKETYVKYDKKILQNRVSLLDLLTRLKLKGKKIIGYGAPAKGNTLLNYFKIGPDILDYIVDDSVFKQGLFTPGTHIPVVSPQTLKKDKVNYILILAWNFADPIMKNYSWFKKRGGKFIVPVPIPKII